MPGAPWDNVRVRPLLRGTWWLCVVVYTLWEMRDKPCRVFLSEHVCMRERPDREISGCLREFAVRIRMENSTANISRNNNGKKGENHNTGRERKQAQKGTNRQCKHPRCQKALMKICTPGLKLLMHIFLSWRESCCTRSDLSWITTLVLGGILYF